MPYFHYTQPMATATATEEPSQALVLAHNDAPEASPEDQAQQERDHRIRVKNRRKYYLDTHPTYFSSDLELADPLLYDRLIRRYQSASEREAEGRAKGYSGVLEADLVRGEAKMEALANPDPNSLWTYKRGANGEIIAEEEDGEEGEDGERKGLTKDEARREWEDVMRWRFLRGEDRDFDYKNIDENEGMDDWKTEDNDREEAYFDDVNDEEDGFNGEEKKELEGETGIQDF